MDQCSHPGYFIVTKVEIIHITNLKKWLKIFYYILILFINNYKMNDESCFKDRERVSTLC